MNDLKFLNNNSSSIKGSGILVITAGSLLEPIKITIEDCIFQENSTMNYSGLKLMDIW